MVKDLFGDIMEEADLALNDEPDRESVQGEEDQAAEYEADL